MLFNYLQKLYNKGIYFIPVKGKGKTKDEAKEPLIPRGFKHTLFMTKEYQEKAKELTLRTLKLVGQKKATAYGLLGAINKFIILDLDKKKFPIEEKLDVFRKLAKEGAYVEQTIRGGIHIVFSVKSYNDVYYAFESNLGEVDNRTFGYIVAYPSYFIVNNQVIGMYKKLPESPELYDDLATINEVEHLFPELGLKYKKLEKPIEGVILKAKEGERQLPTLGFDLDIRSAKELLFLLSLISYELNCEGYCKLFMSLLEKGEWIIPYLEYAKIWSGVEHCRSTWGVIEYNIGVLLRMLNIKDVNLIEELGLLIQKAQGEDKAGTPASKTILQGYTYANWGLDWREFCVMKHLGLCNNSFCTHNVVTLWISKFYLVQRACAKYRILKTQLMKNYNNSVIRKL